MVSAFRQRFIEDGMRPSTRAARRNLLLVSVVTYLLVKGQLIPSEITFLGLKIGDLQEKVLLQTLLALLVYYFLKFYLYMWIDGELQVTRAYESLIASDSIRTYREYKKAQKEAAKSAFRELGLSGLIVVIARLGLDNALPIFGALYAVILILCTL